MSGAILLAATIFMEVAWSPPSPPSRPLAQPSPLERAFGAGSSNIQTLEAHIYCTFSEIDADGWSTCLHWDNGQPDPIMARVVEAEAKTPIGGCILAINDRKGGRMCAAWKKAAAQ